MRLVRSLRPAPGSTLALFLHEEQAARGAFDLPEPLRKPVTEAARGLDFKGRLGEAKGTLLAGTGPKAVQFTGLGPAGKLPVDRLGRILRAWASTAPAKSVVSLHPGLLRVPNNEAWAVALRLLTASDRPGQDFQKHPKGELTAGILPPSTLAPVEAGAALDKTAALREGAEVARALGSAPGNLLTPQGFARRACELARHYGWKATVLGPADLKKRKLPGLVMVGKGSENPPVLVRLAAGTKTRRILVGKGITFDSGGISIKPVAGMDEMKYDKCGAATALGALVALSEMDAADGTTVYLPLAENLPGGRAFRPGDILRWPDGTSVEILSTDAEGRLVLADAIHLAAGEKPEFILTAATLTGAMKFSLGSVAAGLFTRVPALRDRLLDAASATGEFCWELPLWEEYDEMTRGEITTLKNSTSGVAGSITAAAFLKAFAGDTPFAHLDIAYTAYRPPSEKKFKGPSGWGVALLAHALREPGD